MICLTNDILIAGKIALIDAHLFVGERGGCVVELICKSDNNCNEIAGNVEEADPIMGVTSGGS